MKSIISLECTPNGDGTWTATATKCRTTATGTCIDSAKQNLLRLLKLASEGGPDRRAGTTGRLDCVTGIVLETSV